MLASSRFFGKVLPTKKPGAHAAESVQKPGFVDAGGDQDNLLYALATGFVDNLLTRPRTNMPVLTQLLAANKHLILPSQRLDNMADKPVVLAVFIRAVADTLRQIAVKELNDHPELYQEEFDAVEMLQAGNGMPARSLDALANVLNILVVINETEPGKGLHKQKLCLPGQVLTIPHDKIVMRLQQEYYFPLVVNVRQMKEAVAAQASLPPAPVVAPQRPDTMRQARRQSIQETYAKFVADFERHAHCFLSILEAGEIDRQALLQVYVSNLVFVPATQGHIKRADIQHGTQRYFEDAMRHINRPVQVTDLVTMVPDRQVERELCYALARGITLGLMDENKVYAQVEHAESGRRPSRAM